MLFNTAKCFSRTRPHQRYLNPAASFHNPHCLNNTPVWTHRVLSFHRIRKPRHRQECQAGVKEARAWGRAVPRDIVRFSEITSKESPSQQSGGSPAEVGSSESLDSFMRKHGVCSRQVKGTLCVVRYIEKKRLQVTQAS